MTLVEAMAETMAAPTIEEARRVLYENHYEGTLDEIESLARERERITAKPYQLPRDTKVLVVRQGAVFVARVVTVSAFSTSVVVRLVHDESWLEVDRESVFDMAHASEAMAKSLEVLT